MAGEATRDMAVRAIRRLRQAGHQALLAGGCVRDMLLGLRPSDYDVATSATPRQVKRLFQRVLMVGAKFGVAMVIEKRRRLEVTTFRSDLSYSDGRRPDGVKFVSARQDAERRDFTVNGMFYDPLTRSVVDYVGGQEDLRAGLLRAIGDPDRRFDEDYLRMLRAVRFAQRFGFRIEPATADAIRRHADRIVRISGERIRDELEKMLSRPSAGGAVRSLHELGLLRAMLPELYARPGAYERGAERVEQVSRRGDWVAALAALACDLPGEDLSAVARRWGASNDVREALVWLAGHARDWEFLPEGSLADLKRRAGHRHFGRLLVLWRVTERQAAGRTARSRALGRRISRIAPGNVCPAPLVRGRDLQRLGLSEGPQLGRALRAVYEAQLNEAVSNRRQALDLARKMIREGDASCGKAHA